MWGDCDMSECIMELRFYFKGGNRAKKLKGERYLSEIYRVQ